MVGMDTRAAKTDVRRAVLAVTISSFSIAALMGIGALLGAGDFGVTSVRVLLTTVVVGCGSILTLCCLAAVGGRFNVIGVSGFLLTLTTACLGLLMIWSPSEELLENLIQTFGVAVAASVTMAQVCLVVGLAGARRSLAPVMWATVALALVVFSMVSSLITGYDDPADGFFRTLGIVGILDVLGTLVTIAVGVFGRDDRGVTVVLPPGIAARVRRRAPRPGGPCPSSSTRRWGATSTCRSTDPAPRARRVARLAGAPHARRTGPRVHLGDLLGGGTSFRVVVMTHDPRRDGERGAQDPERLVSRTVGARRGLSGSGGSGRRGHGGVLSHGDE